MSNEKQVIKLLEIKGCRDCPHGVSTLRYDHDYDYSCDKLDKTIYPFHTSFDDECPLVTKGADDE